MSLQLEEKCFRQREACLFHKKSQAQESLYSAEQSAETESERMPKEFSTKQGMGHGEFCQSD